MFGGSSRGGMKMRLLLALAIALFAVISYYAKPGDMNEVTGERERVAMGLAGGLQKLRLELLFQELIGISLVDQ